MIATIFQWGDREVGFREKALRHLPMSPSTALPSPGPVLANIHTPPRKIRKRG